MPWGVAAAGVAAAGSAYAAKKGEQASRNQQEPQWLQDASQRAVDRAETLSSRAYEGYDGNAIAGLSGNERRASQLATIGDTQGQAYLDKAGSQLDSIEDYSGEALNKYMNPYTDAVLQPQLREANRQYDRSKSSLLNSKAGAWGGDRVAFEGSELERTHRENVSDVTGKAYADAFQSAQSAFFQDSDRKTRAAQAYQSLGGDVSKMRRDQIQDLMATGGLERLLNQAQLDFDYAAFREARDWDVTNMDPLIKAIGAAKGQNTTTTTTGPQSGGWGQALGAAATIAGAYFSRNQGSDFSDVGSGATANSALSQAGFGN